MSRKPQDRGSVVIYRLGSLGDTIVALPCFHAVRRRYADQRRFVLTNIPISTKAAPLESILGGGDFVHEAIAYPVGMRSISALLELRATLRATGADTLVYLMGGRGLARIRRDVAFFRLCGFNRIIGPPRTIEDDRGRLDTDGRREPEAERLARCLAELGDISLHERANWDLLLTSDEWGRAETELQPFKGAPFVAVNMGGKAAEKDWGEPRWAQFLRALSAQATGHGLLFVGAAEDSERAARLASAWSGPTLDACGRLTPRESGAVLSHARLFIGHDSGPLHLAAAMQVRCVGLFGGFNRPAKWHPYGTGHVVLHEVRGMEHIEVPQALEAAGQLLARQTYLNVVTA